METKMLTDSELRAAVLERLSALMDGELEVGGVDTACSHWRDSVASRSSWHAYQLIGDVLRSDDLASDPAHDADFLNAVRARLAQEPVVLAPRPLESAVAAARLAAARAASTVRGGRWSWIAPSAAAAAGFVAIAGVLMLTRPAGTQPDLQAGTSLARAGVGSIPAVSSVPGVGEPQTVVASGQVIRDARLDRYLDAHKQFAGSSALGVPSAFLRSATTVNAADR
jgi:sigma-E factor negative regulatory protein RseA